MISSVWSIQAGRQTLRLIRGNNWRGDETEGRVGSVSKEGFDSSKSSIYIWMNEEIVTSPIITWVWLNEYDFTSHFLIHVQITPILKVCSFYISFHSTALFIQNMLSEW